MSSDLISSLVDLYAVFSYYKANPKMLGSPIYGDKVATWNKQLFSKPLRDLTADDLSRFSSDVLTTWGNINDFKHFLPRILELIAELKDPCPTDFFLCKLEYGKWKTWSKEEKVAIEEFLLAFFSDLLDAYNRDSFAMSIYFFSILYTCINPSQLLRLWEGERSQKLEVGFCTFVQEHENQIFNPHEKLLFVEENEENQARRKLIKNWFLSDYNRKRLNSIINKNEDDDLVFDASWALGILEKYS